jgi:hypothetical protein
MTLDRCRTAYWRVPLLTAFLCFLFCAASASAQITTPAGRAQSLDVSLGYSYINHPAGTSSRVGLSGIDANATVGMFSRLAVKADLGYARSASGVLGAPTSSSLLNYMAGPVYYPSAGRKFDAYVQGLFGGARVTGPVPVNNGILIGGWANGFAWLFGGGVDYQLSNSFGLRAGVDYLRTGYFDSSLTTQGQSNFRATAALVYFGSWRRKRR